MKTMAEVLAEHQKVGMGMTYGSPDTCRCGAKIYPEKDDTEVSIRRDAAFGVHQSEILTAAGFGLVADAKREALRDAARELMDVQEHESRMPGIRFAVGFLAGQRRPMRGEG